MLLDWRSRNGIGSFVTLSKLTSRPKVTDVQMRRMFNCEYVSAQYWRSVRRALDKLEVRHDTTA